MKNAKKIDKKQLKNCLNCQHVEYDSCDCSEYGSCSHGDMPYCSKGDKNEHLRNEKMSSDSYLNKAKKCFEDPTPDQIIWRNGGVPEGWEEELKEMDSRNEYNKKE